jgi:hypothetical protein
MIGPVETLEELALTAFGQRRDCGSPFVLRGGLGGDSWKSWSLDHLRQVCGGSTVPVEVGCYLGGSKDREMNMADFIDQYILAPTDTGTDTGTDTETRQKGYVAQCELLPQLRKDILIPDFCAMVNDESTAPDRDEVYVMQWIGPVGTITPLHYDYYSNFIAQAQGFKVIRLYPPSESKKLYPFPQRERRNHSQVDVLSPLSSKQQQQGEFPLVCTVNGGVETVIGPGDMLYIPRWWWHVVVSIDVEEAVRRGYSCSDVKLEEDAIAATAAAAEYSV